MNSDRKTELLNLISENNTQVALEKLRQIFSGMETEKQIIQLTARYTEINSSRNQGVISYKEYLLERNKVQNAIIELIFEEEIPNGNDDELTLPSIKTQIQKLVQGQFVIMKKLNEGNRAVVFQGYDIHLRRMVAIKAIKTDAYVNLEHLYAIDRDISSAAQYKHRNIMSVYEARLDSNPKYSVIEYVDGSDLRYILNRTGAVSVRESIAFIWQLGRALEYGHRRNAVHGRVRPSNVLIDEENQAILSSFQILRNERLHADFKKMAENVKYWAPEQFNGEISEYSDQFSLGLTAFEIINGRPLFSGKNAAQIFVSRARFFADPDSEYQRLADPKCPSSLSGIIRRMLEKNPADRWPDMRELTRELEQIDLEPDDYIRIAKNSYKRFRYNREFVEKFYHNFFAHPQAAETRELFQDMERQYKMLRQAVHRLLEFATPKESQRESLNTVAKRHAERNIPVELFPLFMETFIRTAAHFDPKWNTNPAIEEAWTRAVSNGLAYLTEKTQAYKTAMEEAKK